MFFKSGPSVSHILGTSLLLGVATFLTVGNTFAQSQAHLTRKIAVGKATIEVQTQGTGEAVVLLPGTGGDASQFEAFAPFLAVAGYRTIAVSVRGAAGSTGPLEGLTLHDYAADVAAVIEALNAGPAHILGRAGGNRIARCLAADRPDLVKTVTLVAAGGLVPGDPDALAAMDRWRVPYSEIPEEEQRTAFRESMLSPATDPTEVRPWRLWRAAREAQRAANRATPLEDWWNGGRAPLLVIQGEDDRIAPPANGHALKERLGERVRVVDIPKAGHALLFEQPKRITEEFVSFLHTLR